MTHRAVNFLKSVKYHAALFLILSAFITWFCLRERDSKRDNIYSKRAEVMENARVTAADPYFSAAKMITDEMGGESHFAGIISDKSLSAEERRAKLIKTVLPFVPVIKAQKFMGLDIYTAGGDHESLCRIDDWLPGGGACLAAAMKKASETRKPVKGIVKCGRREFFAVTLPLLKGDDFTGCLVFSMPGQVITADLNRLYNLESFIVPKDFWDMIAAGMTAGKHMPNEPLLNGARERIRIKLKGGVKYNDNREPDNGGYIGVTVKSEGDLWSAVLIPVRDISGKSSFYMVSFFRDAEADFLNLETVEKIILWNLLLLVFLAFSWHSGRSRDILRDKRDQLAEDRNRFESMAANVPGVIFRWYQNRNGDCGFKYVSGRSRDLFGIEPAALTADWSLLKIHPDDSDAWRMSIRAAFEKKADWTFEGRFILGDGKIIWCKGLSKIVTVSESEIYIDGVMLDITKDKEYERRIFEKERCFRKVLEFMPVMITAFDGEGNIIFWNRECERVTGYSGGEAIGSDITGKIFPDEIQRKRFFEIINDRDIDFKELLFELATKNGATRMIKWSKISYDEPLTGWRFWIAGMDITVQRETEDALWKRDLLLAATTQLGISLLSERDVKKAIMDGLEILGPTLDADRILIYEFIDSGSPDGRLSLAELRHEWAETKTVSGVLSKSVPAENFSAWREKLASGGCVCGAADSFPPEQRGFFDRLGIQSALVTPIIVHGSLWGIVCYCDCHSKREWSENEISILETAGSSIGGSIIRQSAEESLAAEKLRAEEASKAKSEFLASMTHDIRTPLNGIIGIAGILGKTQLSPDQRQYVRDLTESGELLLSIVNDILDISKIESGKFELEMTPFDLRGAVESLCGLLKLQAGGKGLDFRLEYQGGGPDFVTGDSVRIRQILMNLIGNAIKFTSSGHVRVEVRREPAPPGDVSRHFFSVSDSGIGIPAEKTGRLFEKFSQADSSVARKFGGAGLGLSICKQLVSKMGGEIRLSSKVGSGSVFSFDLPLRAAAPVAPPAAGADLTTLAWKKTPLVLIAEDSLINMKITRAMLEACGCLSDEAPDGAAALEKVKNSVYDLVLMDIQMPVMDGLEAARKIRGLGEPSRSVLIVALTANAMKSEVEKCLAAGMNGCLCKPVRENEMRTALAAYLSKLLIPPSETRTPGPPPPPSSAEPPVPPVLDSKTTLDNIGGNRALLDKMMRIFVEESDLTAARITEAAGRSDFSSLRAALHKMKSESACVGGMRLAMLAARGEIAAEERNAGGLKDALAAVDTARRELKQRIEELTAAGSNP